MLSRDVLPLQSPSLHEKAQVPTCSKAQEPAPSVAAEQRGFPTLPVTRESLFALGALLKAGG